MKLVVLGSTGYHPNDLRQTACLALPEVGVVLDAGTGMYRLREYLVTPKLDIFLSHAHLDHVCGLTFLYDVFADRVRVPTFVHGEADKLAAIRTHLFSPLIFPVGPPFEFRPLFGPMELTGGGRLTYFPLTHPGGSIGYRLDWPGHSLAYVTDTIASADAPYLEAIRGVDLLLHECNFPDGHKKMADLTGHSHTTPVAELARQANVGRLVLLHLYPLISEHDPIGLDIAQSIFANTEIADDRMEFEF
jgi:ribonuclease BN (tRNA processing enzyme)